MHRNPSSKCLFFIYVDLDLFGYLNVLQQLYVLVFLQEAFAAKAKVKQFSRKAFLTFTHTTNTIAMIAMMMMILMMILITQITEFNCAVHCSP